MGAPLITAPVQIFFIVLVIILFAPLLLNKLKIPHIIGMIAAGVVIGPYGFNVLDNDSSFAIFGQVGLLYLMFLAGLEIDMYHLRLNLRRGLLFGVLTLLIPLVFGILTSVYLLGLDWTTSMLLGSMYASHTLLSYPVAARFGITKAPAVLIAIVGTIIAVIGALLVLAATVSIRQEGYFNVSAIGLLAARLVVWVVALLYLYPRITRYFFKKYSDKVTQYVFVLVLVFLAACSAQLIGLEPVLGRVLRRASAQPLRARRLGAYELYRVCGQCTLYTILPHQRGHDDKPARVRRCRHSRGCRRYDSGGAGEQVAAGISVAAHIWFRCV